MARVGCDLSVTDVIEALTVLLSPGLSNQKEAEEPIKDPFLHLLQQSLDSFTAKLSSDQFHCLAAALKETQRQLVCDATSTAVEWQFVSAILQLLHLLSSLLPKAASPNSMKMTTSAVAPAGADKPRRPQDAPPLPRCALSVTNINTVRKALQFVACLGISPNLSPGVGIPLQHRSKFLTLAPLSVTALAEIDVSSESRKARLSVCTLVLAELLKVAELRSVIVSAHLNDMLAVLLQLIYSDPAAGEKSNVSQAEEMKNAGSKTTVDGLAIACVDQGKMEIPVVKDCATKKDDFESNALPKTVNNDSVSTEKTGTNTNKRTECVSDAETRLSPSTDPKQLHRQTVENLLSVVGHDLVIRELMVLQAGMPGRVQSARNPGISSSPGSPPPPWLRKACSHLLLRLVKGTEGILHLYAAMSAGSDPGALHWKRCGAVAKIIAGCPVPKQQIHHYVISVSQQLMGLLHTGGTKDSAQFTQLVGAVASEMTARHKDQFHQHFHQPLLRPLYHCLQSHGSGMEGKVVVSEEDLTRCLEDMHKVYVSGQQPQASILSVLQPVMGVLWSLFCVTRSAVYSIKHCVRELMVSYLKFLGPAEAGTCLQHLCVSQVAEGTASGACSTLLTVHFEAGSNGGVQAVCSCVEKKARLSETQQVEAVTDILQDLKKDGVAGELLVTLLKELTEMISKETQEPDVILPASMERSEVREMKRGELMRRVTLLHLLASICETFGSECLSDNTQILLFVKASLERGVAVCRGTSEEEMVIFETETMSMAMGLLTAVMAGAIKMEEKHRTLLDEMLPLLEVTSEGHPDEFIREMASDIRIAIATRGAVWSSLQENKRGESKSSGNKAAAEAEVRIQSGRARPASKPLIEVLSDHPAATSPDLNQKEQVTPQQTSKPLAKALPAEPIPSPSAAAGKEKEPSSLSASPHTTPASTAASKHVFDSSQLRELSPSELGVSATAEAPSHPAESAKASSPCQALPGKVHQLQEKQEQSERSSLQTVFEELCDPLLPVRGHALITLAKLVQEKDAEALSKKDVVQKVFEENLRHGDSYIYLAAINGLSALADRFPESVVPSLAAEFAGFSKTSTAGLTAEHRLKVGEALMKATRNLGEMTPKYRELLLGAVLAGARDGDATVRASSISNLAELCSLLRFSLGPVLQEVFSCCSSLLESDEAVVRRAAALTLAKILEGLDRDALTVLDSVLKNLYRLLKKLHTTDADAAVRLHANIALVQLDSVAREFLFPKQTLQKKIQVLSNEDTFR